MNNPVRVFGLGKMGIAVVHALKKLGYTNIHTYDITTLIDKETDDITQHTCDGGFNYSEAVSKDTIGVLSCMPYHQNLPLAKACIDKGVPYTDLGGRVDVSQAINDYAKEKNATAVTDLGLAPGLVNLEVMHEVLQAKTFGMTPTVANMSCGGIPDTNVDNILNYQCTWSMDGLVNEYVDNCQALIDGNIQEVMSLTNDFRLDFDKIHFESSRTSGGAAHTLEWMQKQGVLNSEYQTIRNPGHFNVVRTILGDNKDADLLESIFQKCGYTSKDMVVWSSNVFTKEGYKKLTLSGIRHNSVFTAMQQCTAFPFVAAADVVFKSGNNSRGYDVILDNYDKFQSNLNDIGFKPQAVK
jgi:saccharopine dehydrogenase-like NADP-dependent oxidoreductase